ncbi:hydrolase [Actinoplanes sp. NBRC 14428]|uniref:ADP-ribosylglycohydrolase n=1 Tax=Pseudosporangium ferrugineum TaxID=439699 RepID=A0A2T0S2F1_9ACTN|nr:ADP-ribosylglycohydrolase family protein [Pseudosporangium ferrugineum]PRY27580.1 ADP-ribosylglycohydrolase [Pseudosporangium ferrugineum]BCJ55652.1 hydrolase [Actinoplanes sp. NBRC 14428]
MAFTLFPDSRAALAADSLAGLSVGDALGAQYFVPGHRPGVLPEPPWPWTDDTEEACCLVAAMTAGDETHLDADRFADLLGRHFDPYRGYGPGAVVMLRQIREGTPWPIAAAAAFDGQGSAGNGAAMRAAPLGAWHADSPARAAEQGARAAEVTHAHPEGIAGGVAVAVAAAVAAAARLEQRPVDLLGAVLAHTPQSRVRDGLAAATRIADPVVAAYELGTGTRAMAQDSVPFALWVAAHHLGDYPGAVTACIAAGGDMDTTAAMAGGVVAAYTGAGGIPREWAGAREPLPGWVTASREG